MEQSKLHDRVAQCAKRGRFDRQTRRQASSPYNSRPPNAPAQITPHTNSPPSPNASQNQEKKKKCKWKFSNCVDQKMHNNSSCTSLTAPHSIVHHQHVKSPKNIHTNNTKCTILMTSYTTFHQHWYHQNQLKKAKIGFRLGQMTTNNSNSDEKEIKRCRERQGNGGGGEEYLLLVPLILSAMEVLERHGRRLLHGLPAQRGELLLPQTQFVSPPIKS